jgi:chemotaxis protein methyltransferase CheR
LRDVDCVAFLQWALPRLRLRWAGFRKVRRQVCRRIAGRVRELDLPDLESYRRLLERRAGEWAILDSLCRVTISRFFRDRSVFDALRREVLPDLVARVRGRERSRLEIWSAGCASGEEPYSLALLWRLGVDRSLREGSDGLELAITATDRDPHLLERARRATYPEGSLRELPQGWLEQVFDRVDDEHRLRSAYRAGVELVEMDLRQEPPAGPFDLVLCRNLAFTYFVEELQVEVLSKVAAVLRPEGVLVVGGHESLPGENFGFRPLERAPRCFRRAAAKR